jgi:putative membrane protein insertion efficiency factor
MITAEKLVLFPEMREIVIKPIRLYRRFVSPMLPSSCRYWPSCSQYMLQAIQRHGVLTGGLMGAWRLLRCNPWSKGGVDPVR